MKLRQTTLGMPQTYWRTRKLCPESWVPRAYPFGLGPFMASYLAFAVPAPVETMVSIDRADPSKLRQRGKSRARGLA